MNGWMDAATSVCSAWTQLIQRGIVVGVLDV